MGLFGGGREMIGWWFDGLLGRLIERRQLGLYLKYFFMSKMIEY
jgi:hypothetical protein